MPRRPVPDEAARLYLRLAYTLDRRSRKKGGAKLTPWDMDPVRLPSLRNPEEMEAALRRLMTVTRQLPNGFRREWLEDHLPTLRALIAVDRGRIPDLTRQLRDFYMLPPVRAKSEELESLHTAVRRILHAPRDDGLRAAVGAWERTHRLSRGAVLPTMTRELRAARLEARRMFDLPRSERVRLVPMRRSRNSGFCLYTHGFQSTVSLNVDLPWTRPLLRDMAAHEAYPGHHTSQATREAAYLRGEIAREAAVGMLADPTGPVDEGLAENGMRFIGWDRTPDDRLMIGLDRLRWGVDVNLAWMVERGEPRRERLRYAMDIGLFDRALAVRHVRYAESKLWASYGFCYWVGTEVIRRKYVSMDGDPAFFEVLYGQPYTFRQLERAFRRL